ncbi:MAG TPA: T9SS type A sorting domain-containing protein, partial [Chitinophagaceae bacterium]|nr:T9SS type A sorting domain-containing protein [Chitinophagaceae bacterium]
TVNNASLGNRIFSVFPNPVKTIATVTGLTGRGQIQILTMQGKLLKQLTVTDITASIDLSRYSNGLYIIQYKKDKQTQILKLVKQ